MRTGIDRKQFQANIGSVGTNGEDRDETGILHSWAQTCVEEAYNRAVKALREGETCVSLVPSSYEVSFELSRMFDVRAGGFLPRRVVLGWCDRMGLVVCDSDHRNL